MSSINATNITVTNLTVTNLSVTNINGNPVTTFGSNCNNLCEQTDDCYDCTEENADCPQCLDLPPLSASSQLTNYFQSQISWTPILISSGGGTCSYSIQTGTCIKVYNLCIFSGEIQISSTVSLNTGNLSVSLPFQNNSSTASSFSIGLVQNLASTTVTTLIASANSGGTSANLYYKTITIDFTQLTNTDIDNTFRIRFGGSYVSIN